MSYRRIVCASRVLFAAITISSQAQTFTSLVAFDGPNGENPGPLVQGTDGELYGVTVGSSTIFKMSPEGTLTTVYSFTGKSDGDMPIGGLALGTDGNFYGTTAEGGSVKYSVCGLNQPVMGEAERMAQYSASLPVSEHS